MKQTLRIMMATAIAIVTLAACTKDEDVIDPTPPVDPSGEGIQLGEPIGLVYTDFLADDDVIHNADTTELRISKALADKKGITDFLNRPMGIWDQKEHASYLRRATAQRLEGDRYVLTVVRSSIGEVMHGREMTLNTGLYYNPERAKSRMLTRASEGDPEVDKYIDDDNVIHPAAITVQRKSGGAPNEGRRLTRADDGSSATFTIEELFTTPPSGANGWFDWLEDVYDYIVEKTSYDWNDDKTVSLIHTSSLISKDFKFDCGNAKDDTITLRFRCPIEFNLDYTLNIRSHGSIETVFVPIPSYLATYIEGYFEANPQLRIGFSKSLSLPEDKQRITLFQFSGVGFTFMLGPVPLTIDIDPSVYLKFTSTLMGDAYFGVQYDIATRFKAGVKYDGSWGGIAEGEKEKDAFSFINPKVSLEYIGGVGLYFGVDVIIEKVAGPSFNIGPQVGVDAKLSYQIGDDRVKAEIEAKAGIGGEAGAKVKIFGFNVAEWKSYFDIGPQWTIFKYPDDGTGSSGDFDPNNGGGGSIHAGTGDLGSLTGDYVAQHGETLTGTLNKAVKVSIADGATVTLDNATIKGWYDGDNGETSNLWAGLNCQGDATIILVGANTVCGFNGRYPGIHVPEGHTLTIMGSGSLNAYCNGWAAGIGGGQNVSCGNIVIKDGTINATGGIMCAGIGGGNGHSCGDITISGGTVTAKGGMYSAGIGNGSRAGCGNITITDGVTKVTATKGEYAPNSIGAGSTGWCGTVTIGGFEVGNISTSPYTYTPESPFDGNLSKAIGNYVAKDGDVLTGTLGGNYKISIADGATVTLDGVTINGVNSANCKWAGITCNGNATIVLKGTNYVKGFHQNYPGIHVPEGKTLTIRGSGSLTARSNSKAAGIGGGYNIACGNIVIEGGTVNAAGGESSAGIGSGLSASCGNITLNGGTIEARGGQLAAGIGSGLGGSCGNITITGGVTKVTATKGQYAPNSIGAGDGGSCGTVTIGGRVTGNIGASPCTYASGSAFTGNLSQLIGSYEAKNGDVLTGTLGTNAKITIANGATVTLDGATINGESDPNCPWAGITCTGNATIVLKGKNTVRGFAKNYPGIHIAQGKTLTIRGDGSLTATSNDYAAGIGGGYETACGNIVVEGGTITATGTAYSAAIGSGYNASCGNISIKGGTVEAKGGSSSAAIGSAYRGSCGTVTITDGVTKVTATAGSKAPNSIGAGSSGSCGTVTIGGNVTGNITTSPYTFVPPVAVTGVSLSQTSASLKIGETMTLTATVAPSNATNKSVTWKSSNTNVATVANGVVTAKAAGSATITVTTADGAKTAICAVTVGDIIDLSTQTSSYEAKDGIILTGTLGANVKISVAAGATVTLDGVTINGTNSSSFKWAGITCNGDATIILKGTNSVKGFYLYYPGIHIAQGKTLTIRGDGSLSASSNGHAAGIGAGYNWNIPCGNIVIEGGTINATGGEYAAGIGSGGASSCGSIAIKGGAVTAKGGDFSAGIGTGMNGSCGDITITSGVTSVTATKGFYAPNSIGAGDGGSCGTVTIGGKVGAISASPYTYKP